MNQGWERSFRLEQRVRGCSPADKLRPVRSFEDTTVPLARPAQPVGDVLERPPKQLHTEPAVHSSWGSEEERSLGRLSPYTRGAPAQRWKPGFLYHQPHTPPSARLQALPHPHSELRAAKAPKFKW